MYKPVLTVSADHLVGQYCGSTFNTYTTTGTKVIIGFTTDGSVTAAGFRIEVTGENNSDITSGITQKTFLNNIFKNNVLDRGDVGQLSRT